MAAIHSSPSDDISPSFEDTADFLNADRGFVASLQPCLIKDARGSIVWNNDEYSFVNEQPCPATANPKLWRQAQLLAKQGLYRVSPSIYQVRGFDISHITFVEGRTGIIVIDPLVSCECAKAALELYQAHRGVRPVKAMIYSHSHVDHFGGAAGILPDPKSNVSPVDIPVIAPEGFMEEAISENVFAGHAMLRRAAHMYGAYLPRCPSGQIGVGLGMGTSRGKTSLIPPTMDINETGTTLTVDGVRMVFQLVPNTEAPAEMNMYFPDERALLVAECAGHGLHNIATLRGALIRDAKAWSRYLDESIVLFCEEAGAEILFSSHGWPTWGNEELRKFLAEQRDLYAYLHDQTVREMNNGWNGTEIAERMVLPAGLSRAWHTQGFYGSVSHNVKGIYQRYMTWFDGSAENLWKWPPKEEGCRYVECMGGVEAVSEKAKLFMEQGDLRFAATLLGHVVAAGSEAGGSAAARSQAKAMLALVFERLGFGAENATWRNFYLTQSLELKSEKKNQTSRSAGLAVFAPGLPVKQWLAVLSISIDGEKAGKEEQPLCIDLHVKGAGERWRLILSNGALTYRCQAGNRPFVGYRPSVTLSMERDELREVLNGTRSAERVRVVSGEIEALKKLLAFAGIGRLMEKESSNL
ncbi:Beta-lactamase-like protein [Macrophomina phaseolina MS6]|uniref:Beta-lactamase-like protein n=1 Tax=Macrophomina phaseolina (strain MS6) TaxID=1126212 RepID=K2S778_MACPH|nr:Beta-lactamase-like protein [Macrophomina phaseolina MS6]